MFVQNPHPIFLSSIKSDYTITERKTDYAHKSFNWESLGYSLIVFVHKNSIEIYKNSIEIYDAISKEESTFYLPEFYFNGNASNLQTVENNISGVSKAVKNFLKEVEKSLDPYKIEIMQVLIYKIIESYPDIKGFCYYQESLPSTYETHSIIIEDQNDKKYRIKYENISNITKNFYFLNGISLSHCFSLNDVSNHELLENFNKAYELNKKLNVQPVIEAF